MMERKHIPREISLKNPKIIVDDLETKSKLKELSNKTGLTVKAIIIRLVKEEYKTIFGGN